MGQSVKRRKKGRAAKSAPVPAPPENDAKVTVDFYIGGIEFLEGSRKLGVAHVSAQLYGFRLIPTCACSATCVCLH